jgi:pilus biogenesis lipoprotein CpaD
MVGACETPAPGPVDYRQTYRIEAVPTTYVLEARLEPGTGSLVAADEGRFSRFVSQYLRRGRSSMVVATTSDRMGKDADAHMAEFRSKLKWEGVPSKSIEVKQGIAPLGNGNSIQLSFRGYEAKVPENCGNWMGEAGYNPTNLPNANFGCSYQRNIGLMLSDPGDLIQTRHADAIDVRRTDLIIQNYRAGLPTPATAPVSDLPGLSDVGE